MSETMAVVNVARDLSAIMELYAGVLTQAIHKAGARIDGHSLPGGDAMVALAHVANRETNERRVELREEAHLATCPRLDHTRCWTGSEDEDDTEPILQTMLFWSEAWREEKGFPLEGRRPTVATEANVLRSLLEWAWETLPEWEDFATDVHDARLRLENLLMAGARTERGVPCLSCNVELVRPSRDPVTCYTSACMWLGHKHDQGGLRDWWECPGCGRVYDTESYRRAVAQAALIAAEWLPLEDAMHRTGAKRGSIQGWASKGDIRKRKDVETGRMTYNVADIENKSNEPDEAA